MLSLLTERPEPQRNILNHFLNCVSFRFNLYFLFAAAVPAVLYLVTKRVLRAKILLCPTSSSRIV